MTRVMDRTATKWARARRATIAALSAATSLVASNALGQAKNRVVTISEVTIVGRVQKPIASVDVSRIQPKLTLSELKQPFLERIERALSRDPF